MGRVDSAREEPPRLHHLVARVVHGRRRVIAAPHNRELVGEPGVLRQDLAQSERGRRGRNLLEGAADFGRRLGLHVERVELARRAEIEDHDDGAFVGILGDGSQRFECRIIDEREADGAEHAGLQEITAGQAVAGVGSFRAPSVAT